MKKQNSPLEWLQYFEKLKTVPGGNWIFSRLLGFAVPYSGELRAQIEALGGGVARVKLKDRRKVRNHLRSIHAMALANLGELATGLALHSAIPKGNRAILTHFAIEYLKKARGEILASCQCPKIPELTVGDIPQNIVVESILENSDKEPVAKVTATWRVAPEK